MKFDAIVMTPGDRMIRLGFGQHKGIWFIRLDLWCIGFRLSQGEKDVK